MKFLLKAVPCFVILSTPAVACTTIYGVTNCGVLSCPDCNQSGVTWPIKTPLPPATKFVLIPLANIASCDATGRCIMEDSSPPSSQLFDSLDSCLEVVKQVYNYNQAVCVTAHGWAKTNPEWEKY